MYRKMMNKLGNSFVIIAMIASVSGLFAQTELTDLRTPSSKTYLLKNGTYQTVINPLITQNHGDGLYHPLVDTTVNYLYTLSPVKYDTNQYSEEANMLVGKSDVTKNGSLISTIENPQYTNVIYRSYSTWDISGVGDANSIYGWGIKIDSIAFTSSLYYHFQDNTWNQTVYMEYGDIIPNSLSNAQNNFNTIGDASVVTSRSLVGDSNGGYSSTFFDYTTDGNSGFDQYLQQLRINGEDQLDILFKASNESANYTFNSDTTIYWDRSVSISPAALVISWEYENPTLYLSNEYNNGWIPGTLTLTDLTTGSMLSGIQSGTETPVIDNHEYDVKTDSQRILYGVSLQHHHWKPVGTTQITEYQLSHSFLLDLTEQSSDIAKYKEIFPITITSQISAQLEFHDPWYVSDENNLTQPDTFLPLSDQDDGSGNVQVFLDQGDPTNPQSTDPYYSLRAPHLAGVINNNIYVFKAWRAYEPDGTTRDVNGNYAVFNDSTNYDSCAVVFKQAGAVVKAYYEAVNTQPNTTLTIDAGDSLVIPAGSNIQFADKFSLRIKGALIADGTSGAITLTGSGRNATINYHGQVRPPIPDSWLIQVDDPLAILSVKNVTIDNNYGGVSIADFSSASLEHVTIKRTNQGIGIGKMTNDQVLFDNVHIADSHNGVVFPQGFENVNQESSVLFYQCLFTDIEDHGVFIFQENPITANSTMNISFYNCDFYLNGDDGVYLRTDGGTNWADINLEVYNSIYSYSQFILDYVNLTLAGCCNIFYNSGTIPKVGRTPIATITSNPQFVDPNGDNFHLQSSSPAIDQGVSGIVMNAFPAYEVDEDPDFTQPDIGAYYYDHIPAAPTNLTLSGGYYSNPVLNWTASSDGDINRYYIYRRQDSKGSFINIGSTAGTHFTDTDIIIGPPMATWYYYVKAKDNVNQYSQPSNTVSTVGMLKQWVQTLLPTEYALGNNTPNPFNPTTAIPFDLPEDSDVQLVVYNLQGREVARLTDGTLSAGSYRVRWDGKTITGTAVPSGVYLCVFSANALNSDDHFTAHRKLVLLK